MPRAIVFTNGVLSPEQLQHCAAKLQADDLLIAADGGLRHCLVINRCPHLLVGDLDSLAQQYTPKQLSAHLQSLQAQGMEIQSHSQEKNATDLELALWAALARGATHIAIVAAMGGRMDMALSHFLLMAHPRLRHCTVALWQGRQSAWLLQTHDEVKNTPDQNTKPIYGVVGDSVSLLPLSSTVTAVYTNGLRYPLFGETLYIGSTRGLSNQLTNTLATIQIGFGILVVIHHSSA